MSALSSVLNIAGALMHHAADGAPVDHHRRAVFIVKRLAFSFAALACVPFVLAFRGAPTGPEMLVLTSSMAPLAAAMVAARTKRIVLAHSIAVLGLTSLSLTLWLALGCGVLCAMTWLLAAHAEARAAGDRNLSRLMGALTLILLAGTLVIPEARLAPSQDTLTCVVVAGLALVYAWVLHAEWSVLDRCERNEDSETPIWRAISETIDDMVLVFDATGSVVRSRLGPENRLGMSSADLMGRGFFETVLVGDRPGLLKALAAASRDDDTSVAAINLRTGKSTKRVEVRARRLGPTGGKSPGAPAQIVAILREIDTPQTEWMEATAKSNTSKDCISPKSDVTREMGHELRTPLNAIIGFSEILASRTLRPADIVKQQDYARIINRSGHHLLSVVDTILEKTKSPSGPAAITAEPDTISCLPEQRMMQVA